MVIIKSKEFILRPIRISDAPIYFEMMQDKLTKRGLMSVPSSLAEAKKEIKGYISKMKARKPTDEMFIIEVKGKFAGYVHVDKLNQQYFEHRAKMGYCLHPNFRGKGLAVKAVKLLSRYVFDKYKLKRLEGGCRTFNKASAMVLEKSGFKLEGILRKNKCLKGKYLDDMIWAKLK